MFLITLSSGFFYTFPLIASVKCFSCLTMIKIVSPIVLLFCYKKSAAVRSQITSKFQKERFARNRGQVQRLSCCRTALHLAKSLLFTDTSLKMDALSVNGPPEKYRLRTKWSKKTALSVNPHHNGQKFTDKSLENASLSVKCVLITDKSTKIGSLSVNSSKILACRPE